MNEIDIQFVDEPPITSTQWGPALEAIKQRPGTWALVGEGVNPGHQVTLRRHGAEVKSRNHRKDGTKRLCDIYARWPSRDEAQA